MGNSYLIILDPNYSRFLDFDPTSWIWGPQIQDLGTPNLRVKLLGAFGTLGETFEKNVPRIVDIHLENLMTI